MVAPKLFTLFAAALAFAASLLVASSAVDVAIGTLALAVFWLASALWLWMGKDDGTISR